ncbi:MAG TPA: hypothetical protein VN081_06155 [Dongiaceae bacterium]|nr:hypothetical protein [Dongiaceae bacterium]
MTENETTQTEIAVPFTEHLRETFAYAAKKNDSSSRCAQRTMLETCETDDDVLELLDYLVVDAGVHPANILGDIKRRSHETFAYSMHTCVQRHREWQELNARTDAIEHCLEAAAEERPAVGELTFVAPVFKEAVA